MRVPRLLVVLVVTVDAAGAGAVTRCLSPDAFNAEATSRGMAVTGGTLTLRVSGVDPSTFHKGALANLADTRDQPASGSACTGIHLKIFGTEVPGDMGKVKDELYNMCCPTGDCASCTTQRTGPAACETWAGPARSAVLFTSPSQTCDVVVHFAPGTHGYDISCDNGATASETGDEPYHLVVNRVSVLRGVGGEQAIDNANLHSAQFCFTDPGAVAPDAGASVDAGTCGTGNPLRAVSLQPANGSGSAALFQAVYDNCHGAAAFRIVQLYVGDTVAAGVASVQVAYEAGQLGLEGQACTPGGTGVLTGARGSLDCARSGVSIAGNRLTATFALGFDDATFGGTHNVYVDAKGPVVGTTEARLGWTPMGTFTVTSPPVDAGAHADASAATDAAAPFDAGTFTDAAGGADHAVIVVDGGTDPAGDAGAGDGPAECSCGVALLDDGARPAWGLLLLLLVARRARGTVTRG